MNLRISRMLRKSNAVKLYAALGLVLLGSSAFADPAALKPPTKADWRCLLESGQVTGSRPGAESLPGLCALETADAPKPGEDRAWPAPGEAGPHELDLDVSAQNAHNLLLVVELVALEGLRAKVTFSASGAAKGAYKKLSERDLKDPGRDARRTWRPEAQIAIPRKKVARLRIGLSGEGDASPRIARIRLFKLDKKGRNDYWVFLGSGLTREAVDARAFERGLRERFPDHDPYVVNAATPAGSARQLKKVINDILTDHPYAQFFAIHIGGVEVTQSRPFPKGSKPLKDDVETVLSVLKKAGRTPILSRLSYRAYKAQGSSEGVPPDENGSGPYVEAIYDPLIRSYCPAFFDAEAKIGLVDVYGLFRDKAEVLLGEDGVTFSEAGRRAYNEIWLQRAGGVIYEGRARAMPEVAGRDPGKGGDDPGKGSGEGDEMSPPQAKDALIGARLAVRQASVLAVYKNPPDGRPPRLPSLRFGSD
jgi:hypothetical protein